MVIPTDRSKEKKRKRDAMVVAGGVERTREMSRFLAQRVGEHAVAESWRDQRVGAYLGQVLFAQHPPASIGMRNARELVTLSMALDLLLAICSCKE